MRSARASCEWTRGSRSSLCHQRVRVIADQLEVTARSKAAADDAECEATVRTTIERMLAEGQLEESNLTKVDLAVADRDFARAPEVMYHRRLSYPRRVTARSGGD